MPPPRSCRLRAYGADAADLDVRLDAKDRPGLVTRLLARCAPLVDACDGDDAEVFWWNQTVSHRIATVLRLAALTEDTDTFLPTLVCPAKGCHQPFEIELPVDALLADSEPAPVLAVPLAPSLTLRVRPPTGKDQARWARLPSPNAVPGLIQALLVEGVPPVDQPDWIDTVSAVLDESDPLVAFTLHVTCPHCGTAHVMPFDLETFALGRLAGVRSQLLHDVHVLALRYGWSEARILALPAWRRVHYIRLNLESEEFA